MNTATQNLFVIWRWTAESVIAPADSPALRREYLQTDGKEPATLWTPKRTKAQTFDNEKAATIVRDIRDEGGQAIMEDANEPLHQGMFKSHLGLVSNWKVAQAKAEAQEKLLERAKAKADEAESSICKAVTERAEELSGIKSKDVYAIGDAERVVKYTLRTRGYSRHRAPDKVINKKIDVRISIDVRVTDAKYNERVFGQVVAAEVNVRFRSPGGAHLWGNQFDEEAVLTAEEKATISRFKEALHAAADEHNLTLKGEGA